MDLRNIIAVLAFAFAGLFSPPSCAVEIQNDVEYGQAGEVKLLLDMASPPSGEGPFPAVVVVHGGAWQAGTRKDMRFLLEPLAKAGFVAASIEYRLAPQHKWPAQIEDCKCAVRYLRAHAEELRIDPNRIFATGASAGGHLVLMLGLMDAKDGLEGDGGNAGQSSKVQAVANFFGPADLRTWVTAGEELDPPQPALPGGSWTVFDNWLGTRDRTAPVMAQVSPVTYIDKADSPILTMHGAKDTLVLLEQEEQLHAALKKAGVTEKLIVLPEDGHGWGGEKMEQSIRDMVTFFNAAPSAKP